MNELDRLRQLDRNSHHDPGPIDVTDEVMRTLRTMPAEAGNFPSAWMTVAVAGWCVAIGLALAVQHSLASLGDPLAALMR